LPTIKGRVWHDPAHIKIPPQVRSCYPGKNGFTDAPIILLLPRIGFNCPLALSYRTSTGLFTAVSAMK